MGLKARPEPGSVAARYVALLRGINVGGKNSLPMTALSEIFAELGCGDVTTYIQSGNVVFEADADVVDDLEARVSAHIAARFGLRVPVVLRSAGELAQVVRDNPFFQAGAEPGSLHVMFLGNRPSASAIARLDPDRSPPDELAVVGRELYLMCPNGIGRSKLTNDYVERVLATTSTTRNWRTVTRLLELAAE